MLGVCWCLCSERVCVWGRGVLRKRSMGLCGRGRVCCACAGRLWGQWGLGAGLCASRMQQLCTARSRMCSTCAARDFLGQHVRGRGAVRSVCAREREVRARPARRTGARAASIGTRTMGVRVGFSFSMSRNMKNASFAVLVFNVGLNEVE